MKDETSPVPSRPSPWLRSLSFDLVKLTKPKITLLVLFTTFVGFYSGAGHPLPLAAMFHTLAGTALVAGGAAAFNMFAERRLDILMKRTARRPLPSGRMHETEALYFALSISSGGFIYLYALVNPMASIISAIIFAGYLFLYTPLKTRTWFSTFIGAVPGALPAVLGWAAATHSISPGAWSLFAIVFLWQVPHFYAIGWLHRKDYEQAGYSLLPAAGRGGPRLRLPAPLFILLLIGCTFLPFLEGIAGIAYLCGSLVLGLAFLIFGIHFAVKLSSLSAKRLFVASALYLPTLMMLLVLDKTG
jgi:protoheme IX farnesyltransferase